MNAITFWGCKYTKLPRFPQQRSSATKASAQIHGQDARMSTRYMTDEIGEMKRRNLKFSYLEDIIGDTFIVRAVAFVPLESAHHTDSYGKGDYLINRL